MEFLHLLQGIRTPVLDEIFALITLFGEETIFIAVGLLFFWCIDKLAGYYLLLIGVGGTVVNQFLKMTFRIPRPWVLDETFTIVEEAREAATGYSFPSGHTQTSVGIFGGIARWTSHPLVRTACLALCVLVPFSRMYLGVHTPMDVGVSLVLAVVLVLGFYPLVFRSQNTQKTVRCLLWILTGLAVLNLLYMTLFPFPADVDVTHLTHAAENAAKMLGCAAGLCAVFDIERKHIRFDPKAAVWWAQALKLALGLVLLLGIKSGLKIPLEAVLDESLLADGIRYFCIAVFAGAVWPMTFGWFGKLGKKS